MSIGIVSSHAVVGSSSSFSTEMLADTPAVWIRGNRLDTFTITASAASSNYPGDVPGNAFDLSMTTVWTTNGTSTGWLRAQLSTGTALTQYGLMSRSGFATRAPKDWTFEGSNDASSWTVLDTRTGVTGWSSSGEYKGFSFTNATTYTYYRLNVTANNGDTYLDCCEMVLPTSPDSSGNGRGIATYSGTAPTIGASGPKLAADFTWGGSAGFIRTGYQMAQPSSGTYEFWFKYAAAPAADLTLAAWSANSGSDGTCSQVQLLNTGKVRLYLYNGANQNLDSAGTSLGVTAGVLTTGMWHHVVGSWGTGGNKLRINKVSVATGAINSSASPGQSTFRLHGQYTGAGNANQTGAVEIAEAAFFTAKLSDTRTDAHYDGV